MKQIKVKSALLESELTKALVNFQAKIIKDKLVSLEDEPIKDIDGDSGDYVITIEVETTNPNLAAYLQELGSPFKGTKFFDHDSEEDDDDKDDKDSEDSSDDEVELVPEVPKLDADGLPIVEELEVDPIVLENEKLVENFSKLFFSNEELGIKEIELFSNEELIKKENNMNKNAKSLYFSDEELNPNIKSLYFSDEELGVDSQSLFFSDEELNQKPVSLYFSDEELGTEPKSLYFSDEELGDIENFSDDEKYTLLHAPYQSGKGKIPYKVYKKGMTKKEADAEHQKYWQELTDKKESKELKVVKDSEASNWFSAEEEIPANTEEISEEAKVVEEPETTGDEPEASSEAKEGDEPDATDADEEEEYKTPVETLLAAQDDLAEESLENFCRSQNKSKNRPE